MNKHYISALMVAALLAVSTSVASAHGHTSFEINGKVYSFVVGSLNEPIAVDDKTGLDLRVTSMTHTEHEASEISGVEAGKPVVGLENTLKVELVAGNKKKVLEITPTYNTPGSYRAYFIPTVQTTFGYRLFGTIDKVPFDYTFTCNPAGHAQSPEDNTETEISTGVTRIEAAGAFSCPTDKADLGFPEPAISNYDLQSKSQLGNGAVSGLERSVSNANLLGFAGVLLGAAGLLIATKKKR